MDITAANLERESSTYDHDNTTQYKVFVMFKQSTPLKIIDFLITNISQ